MNGDNILEEFDWESAAAELERWDAAEAGMEDADLTGIGVDDMELWKMTEPWEDSAPWTVREEETLPTPSGPEKPEGEKEKDERIEKKRKLPRLLALILLPILAVGIVLCLTQTVMVDFRLYPKNRPVLDLRGKSVTAEHYEKLAEKLPGCVICWDVPFQGKTFSSDITALTITSLSQEDVETMDYFTRLQTVDARQCGDIENLQALVLRRPEVTVDYRIECGGREVDRNATALTVDAIFEEEIPGLAGLKQLETVTVQGGGTGNLGALQSFCHEHGIAFQVELGGETLADDTEQVTVEDLTDEELPLVPLLKQLKQLRLINPQADAAAVDALRGELTDTEISVELQLGGKTIDTGAEEIDLSGMKLENLEQVEAVMSYLPNVKTLFLGVQDGIPNEDMAAFRERSRDRYKVVWEVRFGDTKTLRTDITYFMPGRDWARGPVFGDDISYNLRYCEDLISVDVGHLGSVKTVTWLEGLVNLEYLILAHTDLRSLEGIQACKKLKFLELDWTGIKDLTPLKECTALEDLNIGMAYPDITPLLEMPWLKHIYMIFGSGADAWTLTQALPDTQVVINGDATVASGWRRLPNYYAMRDALHAYYMN